jgi:phage terminase large subunit GpA-like protein
LVKGSDQTIWVKVRRRNDYLDCRSYSVAGAMYLQQRTKVDDERIAAKVEANREVHRDDHKKSRPSYLLAPRQKVGGGWLDANGRYFD